MLPQESAGFAGLIKLKESDRLLITEYNNTAADLPRGTLHQIFSEQAEKTPAQTAVIFGEETLTYGDLHKKSNQVARYLTQQGISRNMSVGVEARRCPETIVNLLGILKAGAAYVPVDPEYPPARREYILTNSDCRMLLSPDLYTREKIAQYPESVLEGNNHPEDLAYIIYTSGSTGRPKGVMITHQAAVNTIIDINRKFQVNETDRIIGLSSMCFDLSVYDIFGALSTGATLVQVADQRDAGNLIRVMEKQRITIWNSVPAIMDMLEGFITDFYTEGTIKPRSGSDRVPSEKAETRVEESEKKYYWSPVVHWKKAGNVIVIGKNQYAGFVPALFPAFYFLTQQGLTLKELRAAFPSVKLIDLESFLQELIKNRILAGSILEPDEVFSTQQYLFANPYGADLLYDPEAYNRYKKTQLSRTLDYQHTDRVLLYNGEYPTLIAGRRTYRKFDEGAVIPREIFSQFCSVFRQNEIDGEKRYYYASAGGLYPIDVFVYLKDHRVEGLKQGLYYYNPIENALELINDQNPITAKIHAFTNKEIFTSSAFSIFLIYNAEVTMPRYGSNGYFYACLDAGIMVGTLTQVAEMLDLGLCSIGDLDFEQIKDYFRLTENQVLIHTIEGGLKPDRRLKEENRPSFGELLQKNLPVSGGETGSQQTGNQFLNTSLRLVLLSGDWIGLSLPERIKRRFSNAAVVSLGGATEASIWSIYHPVTEIKPEWKSIPYGRPLANQRFFVLNYEMESCPVGVQGELYIGGAGLALGYYNDEEKTREAFLQHPALGPLYRTGDYGVFRREGYIEFLGRKDQQVKIRGYRVELGEIENRLLKHPAVKNGIVVDQTDPNGKKYLCAYIVADREIQITELKEFLALELPEYMIPTSLMKIAAIPLTPNGKVDRKALPAPETNHGTGVEYVAPRTETERKMVEIWEEVLGVTPIGINDNFFQLGGHSLKITSMIARMRNSFDVDLPITEFFNYQTIAEIATMIEKNLSKQKTLEEILREIEELPE